MEPQGEGVGGPAEVAIEEGVLQDQPGPLFRNLLVQQSPDSGIVVVAGLLEGVAAVAVKEFSVNGIHKITSTEHLMISI